jgi:hypothetical protein
MRRVLAGLLALLVFMSGCGCAWSTFIVWWEPVLWAVGIGVASGIMLRRVFRNFLRYSGRLAGVLCPVVIMSALSYGAILTINYFMADDSSTVTVDATVTAKYSEERTRYRRSGRGRSIPAGKYNVYYLRLEFPDGSTRNMSVNASTYVKARTGVKKQFRVSDGFFGYKVLKLESSDCRNN